MKTYGQYCPISRAAEILGERWTPVIVRNLLAGAHTFNAIADGAPRIPRSLLSRRLRQLAGAEVITIRPQPSGHGHIYELTDAGRDLANVLDALGTWGARWLELADRHAQPDFVLWAWCHDSLAVDRLPERRVVVRFDFPDQPKTRRTYWVIFQRPTAEVCQHHPGFDEDLQVVAVALTLARWHAGQIDWATATRGGDIRVHGPTRLARQLPSWNLRSRFASIQPHTRQRDASPR
jgi:DNA-binding HxlR family transcriptional regulator